MLGWFSHFRRRIKKEFGRDIVPKEGFEADMYPLAYCCLKSKRPFVERRVVHTTATFDAEVVGHAPKWNRLRETIEAGDDLLPYSSKRLVEWKFNDFLFHSCGVSHLHLVHSTKGGTGSALVFGVFTPGSFHALAIGDHHDLYQRSRILDRVGTEAEALGLSLVHADGRIAWPADGKDFKQWANHERLGGNLLYPARLKVDGRDMLLDGHQRGALALFSLNGATHKVPLSACLAYDMEADYLDAIESGLLAKHGNVDFRLRIDDERQTYVVSWGNASIEEFPIPNDRMTCSRFVDNARNAWLATQPIV